MLTEIDKTVFADVNLLQGISVVSGTVTIYLPHHYITVTPCSPQRLTAMVKRINEALEEK